MLDRETGRPRGFAFVTFSTGDEANAAITGLHGQDLDGRRIKVNLANPKPSGGNSRGANPIRVLSFYDNNCDSRRFLWRRRL